ncbi:MAG: hypothetical protein LE168_04795 [Endomicrobium sp.]|nr:hypothetical protein [Endomicrobium sp.]
MGAQNETEMDVEEEMKVEDGYGLEIRNLKATLTREIIELEEQAKLKRIYLEALQRLIDIFF